MITILMILLCIESLIIIHKTKEIEHWKENAKDEAKKRLAKDEKTTEIRRAIDRGAAKLISEKDTQIRELKEQLRYKTIVNARLWDQLRDLKAGGDFDD